MAYQITIKNSVHEALKELKGNGSYSDVIESMMNKNKIAPATVAKHEQVQASTPE